MADRPRQGTPAGGGGAPRLPCREFLLRVRVRDGDPPAIIRLRSALKCLLRAFQVRCVEVREADGGEDRGDADDATK